MVKAKGAILTVALAALVLGAVAPAYAVRLGYEVTLIGGPRVCDTNRTIWPLLYGWPTSTKGFHQEWVDDPELYVYGIDVKSAPASPMWQRYHWVGAKFTMAPPADTLYVGDYADAPKTPISIMFDQTEPPGGADGGGGGYDTPGFIDAWVFHGYPGGVGYQHSYCVSLHQYGLLNTPYYGAYAIEYEPFFPDQRWGICHLKLYATNPVWVGAVASTADYPYDVHVIPPEQQGQPNYYIDWTPDYVYPSTDPENPTLVFLDVTGGITPGDNLPPPMITDPRVNVTPSSLGGIKASFK